MKTFTNCAEKKAKQILNLLQGYTKGIRMTAILVLLLMGVSNAWGYTISSAKIYYDDSNSKWGSNVVVAFDKDDGGAVFAMTKINNTSLHYWTGSWGDGSVSYMRFGQTTTTYNWYKWGDYAKNTWDLSQTDKWTGVSNGWGEDINNAYKMFGAESNSSGANLTKTDLDGYSSLNYNQTVQQHLSTNGSAYALSTASIATVKVSSYKLSNATTAAADSKTIASGNSTAKCSAARTATVTYSVTGVNTGYKFVGWYDGNTQKSTSTTYTYQATEAKTITARFEKTYAVTISAGANGTVSPNSSQQVGSTKVTIKATANTGYKFKNWTTTGGVVIANANNATTTITATATGTVKANFEEDLSSNWKLIGDNQTNSPFGDNYTYSNGKAMTKKSGHSTESNVYITLDIKHLPASYYGFKVATSNDDAQKYGYGQGEGYYIEFNRSASNTQNRVYSGSQHELKFIPDALGEYEFRVNYPSDKYVYVTFPTAYTVTFGNGTGGSSVTAQYNSTSFNSGTKVQSGKTVTFTQSASAGYTFKEWNTKSDGTGTKLSTNTTYTRTVAATNSVYAIYTKNPDKTIYLEPTGHWNANKAVFQAHVWQSSNIGNSKDIDMTGIGDPSYANNDGKSLYRYYKVEVPAEYDKIVFYREDPAKKTTIWNQTGDLTIPIDNNTLYVITDNTTSPTSGTWKAPNFVYTITLGYCDFGTYGIKYNGQSYFSKKPYDNVTIDVPAGAQIEILEGQPFSNAYTGDVVKKKPTNEKLITGQTLTINGDVTLDDNFVTKKPHVVYLGIPDAINTTEIWANENKDNFIYTWDTYASYGLVASTRSFKIDALGITYYEFTIPEERHSFRFQRKTSLDDKGDPHCESVSLEHEIPLTDVNCFTLKNEKDGSRYKGTWGVLPAQPGDYRLLYVEQVVEKSEEAGDEWKTIITRKKAHPSNIIRKGTASQIVSLHTYKDRTYMANAGGSKYESSNNPEIILQKYLGNDQWEDVECQMVYGPLETLPIMANLPGRKNASPNSNIDDLQHQDGIENIKKDVLNHPDKGNGVWNFVVTQDGDKASVQWNETRRYEGEYYIRTDNAEGGWDQYTLNDNYMTYSQYAKDHSGFSHYFCRWVEVSKDDNTKFVIANDYGVAISDTLAQDAYTNEHGDIAHDTNIRWSWNMVNNEIARAYIQGTWDVSTSKRNRNLVVNYKENTNAADKEDLLDDSGDWIYQKDFPVQVGSHLNSLTAQYPVTTGHIQTFAENLDMLIGDINTNPNNYKVRVLYDFKINKTLVALVPNDKDATISIDVLIERINQGDATQVEAPIAYTNNQRSGEGSTVYGVMSFDKSHLTDPNLSSQEKLTYWISFPFDVKLSEIFGFGKVGDYWMIKYYDGRDRAAKGLYDDNTFWKFITNRNYTLKANQGYVLALNKKVMDANSPIFTNTTRISLYFPSKEKLLNIDTDYTQTTCTIPEYTCTITSPTDRRTKDSNWNFIGVPSFANKNRNTTNENLKYFYDYDYHTDTYSVALNSRENTTFKSMFAYMVQFAGIIDWSTLASNGSQGLAAKKTTNVEKHVLRIELQQNNTKADHTYIQLEDEEVTAMFDMNYDLTKLFNSKTNIYSIIPSDIDPIQAAANVRPIEEAIIPLGVKITSAGEYTFAMPDGTDGIVVELIDYENNTRTNMLLDEYTVNLGKGTFDNRFALHVKPNKTTTSLEDVNTNTTGVKKYLIDGILYMQKDGVLYDAQGKLVR